MPPAYSPYKYQSSKVVYQAKLCLRTGTYSLLLSWHSDRLVLRRAGSAQVRRSIHTLRTVLDSQCACRSVSFPSARATTNGLLPSPTFNPRHVRVKINSELESVMDGLSDLGNLNLLIAPGLGSLPWHHHLVRHGTPQGHAGHKAVRGVAPAGDVDVGGERLGFRS